MSSVNDLSHLTEPDDYYKPSEKETLLSKYRIPIQHFEYEYIEGCKDDKELERILLILRSGEEGHFPDLIKTTEERLTMINPKSKLLRKVVPVINKNELDKNELHELCEDLQTWVADISKHNKELEKRKGNTTDCDSEIRPYQEAKCREEEKERIIEKKIKSTDYNSWDKYDPDTEILKMELAEENERKVIVKAKPTKKTIQKSVTFNKFDTEAEAAFTANREKEKGNEFFKAGDYEDALQCYTNSISSKPTIDNLNNRAVTYIKLKSYRKAVEDCDRVLAIDRENLKAHLRKAEALEGSKMYEKAMECVSFVIRRDPNNASAQDLADRVRKNCETNLKNTRMKIVEIE